MTLPYISSTLLLIFVHSSGKCVLSMMKGFILVVLAHKALFLVYSFCMSELIKLLVAIICVVNVNDKCGRFNMIMSTRNEAYVCILVKKKKLKTMAPQIEEGYK